MLCKYKLRFLAKMELQINYYWINILDHNRI